MLKVLVVEDEYRSRTGLTRLINGLGGNYKVVASAEDGYEGMRLAQELKPDVIFTDIEMPRVNGLEMIEHLVAAKQTCRFVIITGYAEFTYAQQGIRLGVSDYLLKPITVTSLQKLLEKIEREALPNPAPEEQPVENQNLSPMIAEIVNKVGSHYVEKLTLEKFALAFAVTPEYLSSLFSKQMGRPFVRYLKEVRIEHAKRLLASGGKKIYQIAFEVGYTDEKYFYRVFKEMTGLSPKEYVRQQRSQGK